MEIEKLPDLWFHGTTEVQKVSLAVGIDVSFGRKFTDFWQGFYVTSCPFQAYVWAKDKREIHNDRERFRKTRIQGYKPDLTKALITVYQLDKAKLTSFRGRFFSLPDSQWAGFVYNNRKGVINSQHHGQKQVYQCLEHNTGLFYDFVFGPLADGLPGFDALSFLLETQKLPFESFVGAIQPKGVMKDQLSFHSHAVAQCLIPIAEVNTDVEANRILQKYHSAK